jgi:hypothetical protein
MSTIIGVVKVMLGDKAYYYRKRSADQIRKANTGIKDCQTSLPRKIGRNGWYALDLSRWYRARRTKPSIKKYLEVIPGFRCLTQ